MFLIQQMQFNINDQLFFFFFFFLETLLMMIMDNSIKYSSVKTKRKQAEEIRLENDIKTIENEIMQDLSNVSEEKLQMLDQKKER